jgi:hypothetical protein
MNEFSMSLGTNALFLVNSRNLLILGIVKFYVLFAVGIESFKYCLDEFLLQIFNVYF